MQVLYTRCAGLDVHKDTIVACVRCVSPPLHQADLHARWTRGLFRSIQPIRMGFREALAQAGSSWAIA
jgi:hypothetical protein